MTTPVPPVMRTISVACAQEHAFTAFTEEIGRWWPLQTHTVFWDSAAGVAFVDGNLVERASDGRTDVWGEVITWDDLSMVASAFGLDPLAHGAEDRGITLWNKTGTNVGVRCDVGVVRQASIWVTYAVLANWEPRGPSDPTRDEVLAAMNQIGHLVRGALVAPPHRFAR